MLYAIHFLLAMITNKRSGNKEVATRSGGLETRNPVVFNKCVGYN